MLEERTLSANITLTLHNATIIFGSHRTLNTLRAVAPYGYDNALVVHRLLDNEACSNITNNSLSRIVVESTNTGARAKRKWRAALLPSVRDHTCEKVRTAL